MGLPVVRTILPAAAFLLAVVAAHTQPRTLTLEQTLRLADEQSIDVRKARLALERSQRGIDGARSLFTPEVNVTGDYTYNMQRQVFFVAPGTPLNQSDATQAFQIGNRHNAGVAVAVVQPLYDPVRRMQRLVAESNAGVSQAQLDAARALVRMQAEKAFYRALYARSEGAVRDEQVNTALANLTITLARFRGGRAMALDTLNAAAGVARARADAERSRFVYQTAQLALAQVLDIQDYQNITVEGSLDVPVTAGPSGGDPLLTPVRANSAELRVAELQGVAAQSVAEVEGRSAFPIINAVGRWQVLGQSNNTVPDDARWAMTSHVGVSAQWPLSNLWRGDARREEAELRVRESALEVERIRTNDSAQLEVLMLAMKGARAQLMAEAASVEAAAKAVDITLILYKEGRATLLDVENAQARVRDARLAEDRVKLQFLEAYAEMKAIIGGDAR